LVKVENPITFPSRDSVHNLINFTSGILLYLKGEHTTILTVALSFESTIKTHGWYIGKFTIPLASSYQIFSIVAKNPISI
jgi:hypothetical protein